MPSVKRCGSTILRAFDAAQSELIGRCVVLTDGKAGTVISTNRTACGFRSEGTMAGGPSRPSNSPKSGRSGPPVVTDKQY
jgi:hypothetical protein